MNILKLRIKRTEKLIFYLYEQDRELILLLKENFNCKIADKQYFDFLLTSIQSPDIDIQTYSNNENILPICSDLKIYSAICVPKIIHQVWEGSTEPLPGFYMQLADSWRKNHPDWQYYLWDKEKMEFFIKKHFPEFLDVYYGYKYNVQRWDTVRYLILHKIGGLYVDLDYDCLQPVDGLVNEIGKCYFAMEPMEHSFPSGKVFINNALMGSPPCHPFFGHIIDYLMEAQISYTSDKMQDILESTGPHMLTNLYEKCENKAEIGLLPAEFVSPWSKIDVIKFRNGTSDNVLLNEKLKKAAAIHYFWGSWI